MVKKRSSVRGRKKLARHDAATAAVKRWLNEAGLPEGDGDAEFEIDMTADTDDGGVNVTLTFHVSDLGIEQELDRSKP